MDAEPPVAGDDEVELSVFGELAPDSLPVEVVDAEVVELRLSFR